MTYAWLFLLLFSVHVVVAGTCLPMVQRRLPPNRSRGFRTPKTLADERVWYEANAVAGRFLLWATAVSAIASAILFNLLPASAAIALSFGVMVVALGVAVLFAFSAVRRIVP